MLDTKHGKAPLGAVVLAAFALTACNRDAERFETAQSLCAQHLEQLTDVLVFGRDPAATKAAFANAQSSIEYAARAVGIKLPRDAFTGEYQPGPHSIGSEDVVIRAVSACRDIVLRLEPHSTQQVEELVTRFTDVCKFHSYFTKQR